MVRKDFPELQWLKTMIHSQRAKGAAAWPSIILNVRKHQELRPEIEGPYSLFLNVSGKSRVAAENHWHQIKDDTYLLTNQGQRYSLALDNKVETETFNIHFGDTFSQEALHAFSHGHTQLLDNPSAYTTVSLLFNNHTRYRSPHFNALISRLYHHTQMFRAHEFEEDLYALFSHLYCQQTRVSVALENLPVQKKSTRMEIQQRLFHALNKIHDCYGDVLSLDELAATACLSKFHFLRLFREAFGLSPAQYLQQVRLARAKTLLSQTSLPLTEIAAQVGIQNASSLSRLISQRLGQPPSELRKVK